MSDPGPTNEDAADAERGDRRDPAVTGIPACRSRLGSQLRMK